MQCSISNCRLGQRKRHQVYRILFGKDLPTRPPVLLPAGEALLLHLAGRLIRSKFLAELEALAALTALKDQLLAAADDLVRASKTSLPMPAYQIGVADDRYVSMTNMTSFLDLKTCTIVPHMHEIIRASVALNITQIFIESSPIPR